MGNITAPLADAIEKAASHGVRQIKGEYAVFTDGQVYACALGAIGIELADLTTAEHWSRVKTGEHKYLRNTIPALRYETTDPVSGAHGLPLTSILMFLNDSFGWNFSMIAKWLREVPDEELIGGRYPTMEEVNAQAG